MNDFFINNLYTVMFLPLWIFLIIVLGRFLNVVQSKKVISTITLLSTLYGVIFSIGSFFYIWKTPDFSQEFTVQFIKIQDFSINFGIYVDNLSILMLVLLTTVSFIVQFYSVAYMDKDKSFPRFFGYLNLFNFSMIGLVLSPNLFQNYVFWELVGVSSYLLIGFWYKKPSASDAAKKAFLVNRIGDVGLLAGTIAISYIMYQYSNSLSLTTLPFSEITDISSFLFGYTNDVVFCAICVLILAGAFAKSAQFPLHIWLPDAMEGPTPVSALIHSATMVAAGVYLVARLYPIFSLNENIMFLISIIGGITAFICAFFAFTQTDLKRILAYSTSSQLGLMFLALGAGLYSGGIFHLVVHAYVKSMLFLCSGIVIHSVYGAQDIRFMGGLRKKMPIAAICYLLGALSLSGIMFGGFNSKEMIFSGLLNGNKEYFAFLFLLVGFMSAFYLFRSYILVFEGEYRGTKEPQKNSNSLNFSLIGLTVSFLAVGIIFEKYIDYFLNFNSHFAQLKLNYSPIFVSIVSSVVAIVLAVMLYSLKGRPVRVPLLYKLSKNGFYIDSIYNFFAEKIYNFTSKIFAFVDKYLVDGFVYFIALLTRSVSWIFAKMQTGNFQSYLAYSVVFLAVAFSSLMLAYTLIINYGLVSGG